MEKPREGTKKFVNQKIKNKKMQDLSLCLLCYNEEKNVSRVIKNLTEIFVKNKINFEIVAVSNASKDKTLELLKQIKKKNRYLRIVNTKEQIGYGYAVRVGLQACNGKFIGYTDGDDQVSAENIFKVYRKISSDSSINLCKGHRILREDKLIRIIISKIYNILFRLLFNIKVGDINAVPKIMKIEDYNSIKLVQNDWFIDAEIILKIAAQNKKISKVPIVYEKREWGYSNVNWKTNFEFLKNILKYKIKKSNT